MVSLGTQPLPIRVTPDVRVLAFTLGVTLATVLLFGAAPVFRATRPDLAPALKQGRTVLGCPARNRLARGVVVAQVALSLLPLSSAGLFLQSLANLLGVSTGFASTLRKRVSDSVLNQRLAAHLATLGGLVAAFLACLGIYGLMSYSVARRTNEMGIRRARGAPRRDVLRLVLEQSLALLLVGVIAGLALAVAASRLLTSVLFGVPPCDPLTLGLATMSLIAVALLASYAPARRATRISPLVALRYE
jgi:hypothetical protein